MINGLSFTILVKSGCDICPFFPIRTKLVYNNIILLNRSVSFDTNLLAYHNKITGQLLDYRNNIETLFGYADNIILMY